jgi:hypothetical protein
VGLNSICESKFLSKIAHRTIVQRRTNIACWCCLRVFHVLDALFKFCMELIEGPTVCVLHPTLGHDVVHFIRTVAVRGLVQPQALPTAGVTEATALTGKRSGHQRGMAMFTRKVSSSEQAWEPMFKRTGGGTNGILECNDPSDNAQRTAIATQSANPNTAEFMVKTSTVH